MHTVENKSQIHIKTNKNISEGHKINIYKNLHKHHYNTLIKEQIQIKKMISYLNLIKIIYTPINTK